MIPKSLHTVTALVNVATYMRASASNEPAALSEAATHWVERAAQTLGYRGADDPHGLRAKAIAAMLKTMRTAVESCGFAWSASEG